MKNITKSLSVLISLFAVIGLYTWTYTQESSTPTITLFIHGSKPQIHDVFYKVGQYFFLPNLHHADEQAPYAGPRAIISGLTDSKYVDPEHLYFFGWSGKVNAKERKDVAQNLLVPQIKELIARYRDRYNTEPEIHIITHSHGGNVALNLINELELNESDIIIDELIMLAPPVQSWTKEYIHSKNCRKIYNIYSADDWIQIADPQGVQTYINNDDVKEKPTFFDLSKRTFTHHDKLTQVQVVLNHKDPGHTDFIDVLYPPQLRSLFPYQFPRFLPELGDVMHTVKDISIQQHIQQAQKPVTLKINTRKSINNNRISLYLED